MTTTHLQSTTTRFEIIGGPGIADLLDALKYAYDSSHRMTVSFNTTSHIVGSRFSFNRHAEAYVIGIEYESGAAGMFILTLNFPHLRGKPRSGIKAFYDARRRTGGFSIKD